MEFLILTKRNEFNLKLSLSAILNNFIRIETSSCLREWIPGLSLFPVKFHKNPPVSWNSHAKDIYRIHVAP